MAEAYLVLFRVRVVEAYESGEGPRTLSELLLKTGTSLLKLPRFLGARQVRANVGATRSRKLIWITALAASVRSDFLLSAGRTHSSDLSDLVGADDNRRALS